MIKCYLFKIMEKKKLKISGLARETGLRRNTITLLHNEEAAKVELDAMEKWCIYFDCSVGSYLNMSPMGLQKPNEG
ncbi:MAG: helix-turn-helix domain-containing protein [Methylobacter sp.]|jgi:putative transcriptional regulator